MRICTVWTYTSVSSFWRMWWVSQGLSRATGTTPKCKPKCGQVVLIMAILSHGPKDTSHCMRECASVVMNISLFYKAYVVSSLLGYRDIYQCPKCEKVILEKPEISEPAKENSDCCDSCNTWWHLPCASQRQNTVASMESWICCNCLAVATDIIDNSEHGAGANQLCSVCWRPSLWVGRKFVQLAGKLFMLGTAIMKNQFKKPHLQPLQLHRLEVGKISITCILYCTVRLD